MPSLKAIRKRITSVRSTRQITKAMKMVAAAKLRRAQTAIEQARPYAKKLAEGIGDIAARVPVEDHPLLARREPLRKVQLFVLTSDRGLCGGFNSNVNRAAERFIVENRAKYEEISLAVVGRKAVEYFRRRRYDIKHEFRGVFADLSIGRVREIADQVIAGYTASDLDAVYMVYNEFKNAVSQKVVVEPLLPVSPAVVGDGGVEYLYEPGKRELLDLLLPRYVEIEIMRALLESVASEHGARMTAMDSATKNASEMIGSLTLQFNRARQAAITKELMEIIGGAEALKG
ncbi:MAG: ATP synthase F1 subunit gamma [Deltaproteobacteria bacterium]|nr:ATP synthase F1 subunit gamma [Deltaproteobacteria bacterium]